MTENKVRFGIKKAYYSIITEGADDTFTYATPLPLPGATALTLTPKGELTEFYADDILYYTADTNQGYDTVLTLANIPESFREKVLGEELDEVDKVLIERNTAKSQKIAFLFEFAGDKKATRHLLYNCTVRRPGISSTTKTTTQEPGTTELNLTAGPRPKDGKIKVSTVALTPPEIYDAWYSKVYEKTPAV